MELECFPYKDPEKNEDRWGVDAESILNRINFLEEFYGDLSHKEMLYTLKRELLKLILTKPESVRVEEKPIEAPADKKAKKDGAKATK
jgi:hypothetical protein